jgi:hypothetical protein
MQIRRGGIETGLYPQWAALRKLLLKLSGNQYFLDAAHYFWQLLCR